MHRSERADRLVDALAGVLADPPEDPFDPEVVAVGSRGIERWLSQELALRLGTSPGATLGTDGVCANVWFPFPSRVVARALAEPETTARGTAVGWDDAADEDPWSPRRLMWPLLEVIEAQLGAPWLGLLRAHLGDDDDASRRDRRLGTARRVAQLFDRYGVHRPSMVRLWNEGRDLDGSGNPLEPGARWQPELWRRVRERVGEASPAERIIPAVERLRSGPAPSLPRRLALFGLTALPASYVTVLDALAAHHDVHLLILHPSPALWDAVAAVIGGLEAAPSRDLDPTRELPRNPLLASWGRDARELQLVVTTAGAAEHRHHAVAPVPARTLLERIQQDMRGDRVAALGPSAEQAGGPWLELAPGDRSLQVHACHGRTRQVEVLRDAILHLLAEDPTLEPRDVVVMCPDIETFAPIVQAVFAAHAEEAPERGAADPRPGPGPGPGPGGALPDVRVRLADRSLRQTNLLLRVVADLLALAEGRLTASDVLDLAVREPVRARFGFDDRALERLEDWVGQARVRWGYDVEHRARFGLDGVRANTWRAGLDRVLLGVAMADEGDRLVGGTVPLDDVEGDDVALAGRLAEFLERLEATLARLREPQPVAAWRAALEDAVDALTATDEQGAWQRRQVSRLLGEVVAEAGGASYAGGDGQAGDSGGEPCALPLSLGEARSLLEDRLRGRPTRANHRTGDLTVATLVPMRSVPHRVVCLLGMDDGAFPRQTATDGDDLIDRDPYVGDRDHRTEDRQLLLDALLAAQQHLVVTYTGRDERTNEPRPPAVPIGELLDLADRTAQREGGRPAREQVLVEHPLQAFDARNFTHGGLVAGGPWGFDPVALAGARARSAGSRERAAFLPEPLPPLESDTVELADLERFLEHPVRSFLRRRLDVALSRTTQARSDAIPVELDGLERHTVGDRLLRARLSGGDVEGWLAAERARGTLPPGALADRELDAIQRDVQGLLDALAEHLPPAPGGGAPGTAGKERVEIDVALPDGRVLTGAVEGVVGEVLLDVRFARLAPAHRLRAWTRLLAVTAAWPERPWEALTIARAPSQSKRAAEWRRIPALPGDPDRRRRSALDALGGLLDLYDRGLRAPLPLYCKTSAAYAEAAHAAEDEPDQAARAAAAKVWATGPRAPFAKEDREPEHELVLGGVLAFDELLEEPPCPDEHGDGWPDDATRLGRYARRLWDGLLAVEDGGER